MSEGLRIDLFGTMRVLVDDEPLPKVRSRKAKWLLALLALRGGKPVGRSLIAGTLWPDAEAAIALTNLRSVINDLRHALRTQADRLRTPDRTTLAFDLDGVAVDALAFDAAIQAGESQRATELYAGPLLQDCDEEWILQDRAARERTCLKALRELAGKADPAGAVALFERAAEIAPWQEAVRRDLMNALVRAGDVNAALAVYREYAQAVRAETGGAPDLQTTELYVRLRSGEGQEAPKEGLATGSFPHPISSFVGREDELLDIAAQLRRHRLVTLVGPGGVGKTRLAREVAQSAAGEFADGAAFVGLEATRDEAGLLRQVAAALGVRESPERPLIEGMLSHLRSRRLLLALDNCEHLLTACANVVERLLTECAELRVLATSREPLGPIGEKTWAVPGLTVPDPRHLPEHPATRRRVLMGYESVRLFVERAGDASSAFDLTQDNSQAVAELCGLLDGSPLALELAASRTRTMRVEEIVERLRGHRLDLLAVRRSGGSARHQSLRATLDWSYSLLTPEERRLLARLAVFSGGWTLAAAEAVAGATPDLLESLVEKSLVRFSPEGRYGFLETVREYAAERLDESGERPRLERDHLAYFAELTYSPLEVPFDSTVIQKDVENCRAALDHGEGDPELSLRLAANLGRYLYNTTAISEGVQRLETALARAGQASPTAKARAHFYLGNLRFETDPAESERRYETCLREWRELGEWSRVGYALRGLGMIALFRGDFLRARAFFDEVLTIARRIGIPKDVAGAMGAVAQACLNLGEQRLAEPLVEESLALLRKFGSPAAVAWGLRTFGSLAYDLGDYEAVQRANDEAVDVFRELHIEDGVAWCLNDLGRVETDLGRVDRGREILAQAVETMRRVETPIGVASVLESLGANAVARGDFAEGRLFLKQGLETFRSVDHRLGVARIFDAQGDALRAQNDPGADAHYREALTFWRDVGDRKRVRDGLLRLSDGAADFDARIRLLAVADRLTEEMDVPVPLPLRERHERALREARERPGFEETWAASRAMTLDDAL